MKLTILGSGTSSGVPQVGCSCEVCKSTDARDRRLRCSGLVEVEGVRLLIDCGPDFRSQMLALPPSVREQPILLHNVAWHSREISL